MNRWLLGLSALLVTLISIGFTTVRADDEPKDEPKPKNKKKDKEPVAVIAHIKLSGDLDESPLPEEPLFGEGQENLATKLARIDKAAKDEKVKALFLEIDGLALDSAMFGYGKVEEVRRAIEAFKKSGKKVYVYTHGVSGKDYLIALAGDVLCLPEGGEFAVVGLRAELSFYKDLFDKIGVKADFLQMGDFKGAAEPFIRNSMSKENRQQFELVIDDFYENDLVATIVKSRPKKKWTPEQVKKLIDEAPYTAAQALKLGVIDRIAYRDDFEEQIKKEINVEGLEVVKDYGKTKGEEIDASNPFAILKMLSPPKKKESKAPKIAIIYAIGEIVTGKGGSSPFGGSTVGSTTIVEAIEQAEKDPTVKAIVLRVDSPGGSALASDLIWHAIQKCKKPVIASMSDIAASGGYYISMGCKKIFAEPGTLTGSIGVVGGKLVTGGVYDWVGIKTEVISRGQNTGVMSGSSVWTEAERKAIKVIMQDIYDQFLDKAVAGRKAAGADMTKEKLLALAGGRIWTGRQAKASGLVDVLGTIDDAIGEAKVAAGLKRDEPMELLILPKPISFLDSLLEGDMGLKLNANVQLMQQIPELRSHLHSTNAMLQLRNERVWMMMPYRVRMK